MKFVCDGLILSEAVNKVSKACAVRTTAPILECIKISAHNDRVTFLASDGELSIEKTVKAEIFSEGEVCVPGKLFTDFISKLSGVQVVLNTGDRGMEIKYGDSVSYMQYSDAEEFPKINLEIGENHFVMKQKNLKKIIAETVFCCATDDSRPILKGCLMEFGDELEVTALDGYRFALSHAEIVEKSGETTLVCPARTLTEIARMLGDDDTEITLYTQGGMMMVKFDDLVLVSRLYQGDFIRKGNVVPQQFVTTVTVNKADLVMSAERAAILIRGDKNNLVTLDIKNGSVALTSISEYGNVAESVDAVIEGKELLISMNAKYLLDALKGLDEERVTLSFNGSTSPFVLQNEEKKDILYLILPVRNIS